MELSGIINVSVGNAELAALAFKRGYNVYAITLGCCKFDVYERFDGGILGKIDEYMARGKEVMPIDIIIPTSGEKSLCYIKKRRDLNDETVEHNNYVFTNTNRKGPLVYIAFRNMENKIPKEGLDAIAGCLARNILSYHILDFYAMNNLLATLPTMYYLNLPYYVPQAAFLADMGCEICGSNECDGGSTDTTTIISKILSGYDVKKSDGFNGLAGDTDMDLDGVDEDYGTKVDRKETPNTNIIYKLDSKGIKPIKQGDDIYIARFVSIDEVKETPGLSVYAINIDGMYCHDTEFKKINGKRVTAIMAPDDDLTVDNLKFIQTSMSKDAVNYLLSNCSKEEDAESKKVSYVYVLDDFDINGVSCSKGEILCFNIPGILDLNKVNKYPVICLTNISLPEDEAREFIESLVKYQKRVESGEEEPHTPIKDRDDVHVTRLEDEKERCNKTVNKCRRKSK